MLVLVLDTSTPAVTAALAAIRPAGVEVLAERVTVDGRAHGELLAPQIDAVLTAVGVAPADLSAVVAGVGPGPFTGLRVGLVTAVAFVQALNIRGYGVCSLDALGHDASRTDVRGSAGVVPRQGPERVLVATDARRKEIYWAEYVDGLRVSGPDVSAPSLVRTEATRAVGDGALRYADVLGLPVDGPRYPPAAALAALAADRVREGAPGEALTPLYLRRPDAVVPTARKSALPA